MNQDLLLKIKNLSIKEVLERKIVKFGTGSHIIVPQKHNGKKVFIIVVK